MKTIFHINDFQGETLDGLCDRALADSKEHPAYRVEVWDENREVYAAYQDGECILEPFKIVWQDATDLFGTQPEEEAMIHLARRNRDGSVTVQVGHFNLYVGQDTWAMDGTVEITFRLEG